MDPQLFELIIVIVGFVEIMVIITVGYVVRLIHNEAQRIDRMFDNIRDIESRLSSTETRSERNERMICK